MGLLQAAYETYESQSKFAGVLIEGWKEALLPVAHSVQNARIEIELSGDGQFLGAKAVPKAEAKTITPATEESVSRTSSKIAPYPLTDKLEYLAAFGEKKFTAYVSQLKCWADSPYTHPKVQAVLAYILGGTILTDLLASGVITLEEDGRPGGGKIEGDVYVKCAVRWRVLPAPAGVSTAAWEDQTLFEAFRQFYASQQTDGVRGLCAITGRDDAIVSLHPKGIVQTAGNAKLISANDGVGFTYRGRFTEPQEACTVGYTASQKAHCALRWLAVNEGVILGQRTFLCWNPAGRKTPKPPLLRARRTEGAEAPPKLNFASYQKGLRLTLGGYRKELPEGDQIVTAALEAATPGRLSVTYFNQLKASDFLDRLQSWYETCCWDRRFYGLASPALRSIVECAFGTDRGAFIEADDRVVSEHTQQLLPCITEKQPIPADIVRALTARASMPQAYSSSNHETVLWTACAVLRKYHNDRLKREEFTLELDLENRDRSYLFGRLLAVYEQVERVTYNRDETRETNAMRMQIRYAQQPLSTWGILEEKLNPYFNHLAPALRAYFKNIIGEITGKLPTTDKAALQKKLDDTYLLGYYLQRAALTRKKSSETDTATEMKEEH